MVHVHVAAAPVLIVSATLSILIIIVFCVLKIEHLDFVPPTYVHVHVKQS